MEAKKEMTLGKVHLTAKFARFRVRNPGEFLRGTFRTQAIGHHGTERISGRLKKSGRWATQTVLVPIRRYRAGERVVRLPKGRFGIRR